MTELLFVSFTSAIDAGFWFELISKKLNDWKLDCSSKSISCYYSNTLGNNLPALFNVTDGAFGKTSSFPNYSIACNGTLYNTNTITEFYDFDKRSTLNKHADKLWNAITSDETLDDPSILTTCVFLTFCDIKKYKFYYWLCFPALHTPPIIDFQLLTIEDLPVAIDDIVGVLDKSSITPFRALDVSTMSTVSFRKLKTDDEMFKNQIIFVFFDPSNDSQHPGWPLRNFLAFLLYNFSDRLSVINILCLRLKFVNGIKSYSTSIYLKINQFHYSIPLQRPAVSGWEKTNGKLRHKFVDLSSMMDPVVLSENAVDLNLKLMTWRAAPSLDLSLVSSQKCLIFGAGTLGCNVARLLMSWGVRKLTFIDNGRISYSNPVRQSLYDFNDCANGGNLKAITAANKIRSIFPGIQSAGHDISIPMPGHPVSNSEVSSVNSAIDDLVSLVQSHDVLFLLLDTRESRWLPTLLGTVYGKFVLNAALGFDSYLAMRHGYCDNPTTENLSSQDRLGCYFCNDIVAPLNSTRDRTLDQQCTVTRPGLSMIAAGQVVELFAAVVTHPRGKSVSALLEESDSPMGVVPHQYRSWLSGGNTLTPTATAFARCTACSATVFSEYLSRGKEFLFDVFNNDSYLEKLTGLDELKNESYDIIALSDDDED